MTTQYIIKQTESFIIKQKQQLSEIKENNM